MRDICELWITGDAMKNRECSGQLEKSWPKVKGAIEDVQELWNKVRTVLMRALKPYPEARMAVMQAIEEEFIPSDAG